MAKSPAFQFYAKDWLSDANVRSMSFAAKGVYIDLLAIYWNEGGLPASTDRLARLVGMAPAKFRRLWPAIEPCFVRIQEQLSQKRLEDEKSKQEQFRQIQTEKSHKAVKARAINTDTHPRVESGSPEQQNSTDPRVTSPFPFPFATTSNNGSDANASVAAGEKASRPTVVSKRKGHPTWLSRPGELWRARWGDDSKPPYGEMAGEFAESVEVFGARGDLDELWARWERFLAASETSQWARPARFVQGLGEWAKDARPGVRAGPAKQSIGDQAMSAAADFLKAKGGNG